MSLLLVALLQLPPPAPASTGTADVAWLREHLTSLVDGRAARVGGPKMLDPDERLGVLLTMLRVQAENPSLPIAPYVREAKTLEALWGRSTAVFTVNLMLQVSQARPPKDKLDEATCGRVCDGVVRSAGEDTVVGLQNAGWPMPPESAALIREAATSERAACLGWCAKYPVPAAACVEKAQRQSDLMTCWKAP